MDIKVHLPDGTEFEYEKATIEWMPDRVRIMHDHGKAKATFFIGQISGVEEETES